MAIWTLCLVLPMPAAALAKGGCPVEGGSLVDAVLSYHLEQSADLMNMRGLPPPPRPRDVAAFAEALHTYLQAGTALVMYGADGADLCVVLVTAGETPIGARVANGLQTIDAGMANFASARGIAGTMAKRAPSSRGVSPVETGPDEPVLDEFDLSVVAQAIFPPEIRKALAGITHLLIAPGGSIARVPFAALPLDGGDLLVDRMTTTILPSVIAAAPGYLHIEPGYELLPPDLAATLSTPLGPALVVGDPDSSGDLDWEFPQLPGARVEASAVANLVGTKALLGAEATPAEIQTRLAASPKLIYFAAHGIADPEQPLDGSFIKLAGGRLSARDIQSLQLPHVPVFLSACQTGLGFAHEGGMIGLARAFEIAGAGPVLMSLWNIDDEATKDIMVETVRALEKHSLPDALRLAVLDYRRVHPGMPETWAAFSIFGR